MTLVSVVVPVYCNAGSLPILHERLVSIAQQHADKNFEFIFVDDGSFDDSYNILAAIAKNDNKVQIIKLSRNFGSNIAPVSYTHLDVYKRQIWYGHPPFCTCSPT